MTEQTWNDQLKEWYTQQGYGSVTDLAYDLDMADSTLRGYLNGNVTDLNKISRQHRKTLYRKTGLDCLKLEFKLPEFEGKEFEIGGQKHKVNFLRGDFGREVIEEFKDRVRTEYQGNSSLDVLSWYDGRVEGSNPFAVVLINQIIRSGRFRTATPADLERVLEQGALNLGSCYNDTALVLRTQCEYNARLAQHLAKQIKDKKGKFEYPVMIPLSGLDLDDPNSDASKNSDYGLAFKLREDAEIIPAPQLMKENHGQTFDRADEKGLPILGGRGNRTLHNVQFGLVWACLSSDRDFYANGGRLRDSNEYGRVVVVSAEGAALENLGGNQ